MTEEAEPMLTVGKDIFEEQISDEMFWNLPINCFRIEGSNVRLKGKISSQIEWGYDATVNSKVINVNAYAGEVEYNSKKYYINPGSFCSNIKIDYIVEDIESLI